MRYLIRGAAGGVICLLAACDQPGFSGLEAEWQRARSEGDYHVVHARPDRAIVSALGRQVAIEPAEGFCVAERSIETSRRSAFALIGDCVLEEGGAEGPRDARGGLQLPRGVPSIVTVSISGDPGFAADRDTALTELSAYLDTAEGRELLGRGGPGTDIEVLETRRIGNGVYVLVDDKGSDVVPILDPRFWRAFLELNDRLAVVTVSGFRASPLGQEEMLKYLVNQVQTLEVANAAPLDDAPVIMVAEAEGPRLTAGGPDATETDEPESAQALEAADGLAERLVDLEPESVVVVTRKTADPVLWPLPNRRPDALDAADGAREDTDTEDETLATEFAPREAPQPPVRPNRA